MRRVSEKTKLTGQKGGIFDICSALSTREKGNNNRKAHQSSVLCPVRIQDSIHTYNATPSLCGACELQHLLVALEKLGFGLEEALHDVLHQLARLILELDLGRAKDLLEDHDELGGQALDGGLVGFV